jgi:hypothetical protein
MNPIQVQALVLSSVVIGKTRENTLDAAISAVATIIGWFSFATNVALVRTHRQTQIPPTVFRGQLYCTVLFSRFQNPLFLAHDSAMAIVSNLGRLPVPIIPSLNSVIDTVFESHPVKTQY